MAWHVDKQNRPLLAQNGGGLAEGPWDGPLPFLSSSCRPGGRGAVDDASASAHLGLGVDVDEDDAGNDDLYRSAESSFVIQLLAAINIACVDLLGFCLCTAQVGHGLGMT